MKLRFGECDLDTDERVLLRGGRPVHLTPKAFQLLSFLADARPRVVPKSELLETLWPSTFVSEGNLATLVKEARLAVGDDARKPVYIRTVHGYGYSFAAPVEQQQAPSSGHSILVLPFENRTGEGELEYLCDGIAENLTNAFSRVSQFRVLSPRTAFRWKGSTEEPEEIGRQLRAGIVIHGAVGRAGGHLTVQVDAVEVASATQIWGNRFRANDAQLFRIEEDIAAEVVAALQLRLSDAERSAMTHRYTSNPHAYDHYLRGRFQWNRRTEEGLRRALEHFERAIVADPGYALPHSGIADVWVAMGTRDLMAPREAFGRALHSATRALELGPNLAEALVSLGAIAEVHQWDWNEAGRKFRRAIELSPSYATAHQWYALHFARRGAAAEAEQQMARALDLDPHSAIVLTNAALLAYLARDHDLAAERIEKALEVEPGSIDAILVRGGIHEAAGRLDEAAADYQRAIAGSSRYTAGLGFLGHLFGHRGEREKAEEVLRRLEDMRANHYVSASYSAIVTIALGRFDEAFSWLETAVREKSGWLVYLRTERRFDPLRHDRRFDTLLRIVEPSDPDS